MNEYNPITDAKTLQYSANDVDVMLKNQRQKCVDDIYEAAVKIMPDILPMDLILDACLNAIGESDD